MIDSKEWGSEFPELAERAMLIGWHGKGGLPGLCEFVGTSFSAEKGKLYGRAEWAGICHQATWDIEHRLAICEVTLKNAKGRRGIIRPALRRFRYWLARLIAPKD